MEDFRIKLNKKTRIYALLFFMSIAGIVLLAAFGKNNSSFNASSGFFGGMAACRIRRELLQNEKSSAR